MKTYKIKSLICFIIFAVAAFFYNKVETENNFQEQVKAAELVDLNNSDLEDIDSNEDDTHIE